MHESNWAFSVKQFLGAARNPFAKALQDGPGFSFQAQGIGIWDFPGQIVIKSRQESVTGARRRCEVRFAHPPSGLEAELVYDCFAGTNVLEIESRLPIAIPDNEGTLWCRYRREAP